MQSPSKIILGIDPGTVIMGYGLIQISSQGLRMVEMDVLKLGRTLDAYQRLERIQQRVAELIRKYRPVAMAIEAPFFGKNVQSMLKLGRAQGVAIATAMQASVPVTEYSPRKIKQSITGNGNAGKEQVWKMLQHLLSLEQVPFHLDASDAVAVALCHHFQQGAPQKSGSKKTAKKSGNWAEFLKNNPGRLRG